jgi:MHS family proline/betaine transporter-like MFS transporter
MLMLVGTLIMALTPSFASIGVLAPALVVLARLIQGFSAGGEFGSAAAYLTEQSPTRRGFFGSWQFASQSVTSILAAGVVWAIYANFSPADIQAWAWRLPFVFGLLIGPVGLVMRRSMRESDEFTTAMAAAPAAQPPRAAPSSLWWGILATAGLVAAGTVSAYVLVLYLPTFAIVQLHLAPTLAQSSATLAAVLSLVAVPLAGALSDRLDRLRMMQTGLVLACVAILPLFAWLLASPSFARLLVCQLVMASVLSLYSGPLAALMAEVFPLRQRTFGMSVGYNLAVVVFGGFSPMILTALIHKTNSDMAPAWYVLAAALISVASISAIALKRKSQAASGAYVQSVQA